MRWTGWVLMAAVVAAAGSAVGGPGCANCGCGSVSPWDAEPCAGPPSYCLVPGCCEDHRHCCDNAWAGYCDYRTRVDAFWYTVGQPYACGCRRPCRQAPQTVDCSEGPRPTPAVRPTPAMPSHDATPTPIATP